MSVKASAQITLSFMVDVKAVYRYYKLQSSTAAAPEVPTTAIPDGWTDTEPTYTEGSTNTLYTVDKTVFTNDTFVYSAVSKSTSYEAAKAAYNKAVAASDTANDAKDAVDNLEIGGRNLALKTSNEYSYEFNDFDGSANKCPTLAKVLTDGLSVGDTITIRLVYKYTDIVAADGQTAKCWLQGSGDVTGWGDGQFPIPSSLVLSGSGEYTFLYSFVVNSESVKNSYWSTAIRHDYVQSGSVQWKMFKVEKGNKATDWTPAPEDVEEAINAKISSVDVEYYLSTSATSLTGGSWSTTAPTWVDGTYIWSRTKITDGAGNITYSPSETGACIAGATESTGKGISSIEEQYYQSTSTTELADGSWSTTYPGWEDGKYIWTKSVITYTDGTTTTTTAICVTGQKGDTGADGKDANQVVHTADGAGNTAPYILIAQITNVRKYSDAPMRMTVISRGRKPTRLTIGFTNETTTDQDIAFFYRDGPAPAYIYKSATSTYELYLLKSEDWDYIQIADYYSPYPEVSAEWKSENTESLPDGYIEAIELIGSEEKDAYTTQMELTQTSEELRLDFNKTVISYADGLQNQIDSNSTYTENRLNTISKYIRFVDGKIILGELGNELTLTIQNDRLSFMQSEVEVAYFSNNKLYIKQAEVLTSLKVGKFEWIPGSDGSLSLRKRG